MDDALTTLASRLRGELLVPDEPGYDTARRGYNRRHDHRPAVIVRPVVAGDGARALDFATSAGLQVAVRSGAHSLAGYGTTEGGLLIDLSAMQAIQIDAAAQIASVEAGDDRRPTHPPPQRRTTWWSRSAIVRPSASAASPSAAASATSASSPVSTATSASDPHSSRPFAGSAG